MPRTEIAAAAARAPRVDAKRVRADIEALRYRAVKAKDHGDPGHFSWIVFDSAKPGPIGEFTYVADCISAEHAQLVADALNAYVADVNSCGSTTRPKLRAKRRG